MPGRVPNLDHPPPSRRQEAVYSARHSAQSNRSAREHRYRDRARNLVKRERRAVKKLRKAVEAGKDGAARKCYTVGNLR